MTAIRRRGQAVREVTAIRTEEVDGVFMAVIVCPFCGAEHAHVAPRETVAGARMERYPRCNNRRGTLYIALPEPAEAIAS